MQVLVREIMTSHPICVTTDESVGQAASIMEANKIGCLPVLEGSRPIGIITSHDIRTRHPNRLVADAMSPTLITVKPDTSIWEAAEIMRTHEIEHLLVTEGNNLIGLITKGTLYPLLGLHCDHLTNLPRATYGCHLLAKWLSEGEPAGVVFLDLDDFGEINRRFGHAVGDRVLCETAKTIVSQVAAPAATCRYGGDEFLVVAPEGYEKTYDIAYRILEALDKNISSMGYPVGASAGIAYFSFDRNLTLSEADKAAEDLISKSSLAAMQAKAEGLKIRRFDLATA